MIFWTTAIGFVFLGFFQITILAMINKDFRNTTQYVEEVVQEDYGTRFNWTLHQEGQLISSYYYGLAIMSLPGGIMTDLFGPFKTILVTHLVMSAVTSISVPLSGNNIWPLFICRFIVGLCAGLTSPCMMGLIAKWAPPTEKPIFTACVLGFVFGDLSSPPLISLVIRRMGWEWSFYLLSLCAIVFIAVWICVVSDYPPDNWFCSKEEALFIEQSLEGAVIKGLAKPPIWKMLKSVPFIVLILGHFGMVSGISFIVALLPKFLDEALGFDLQKVGTMTAVPSIGKFISGFSYGAIAGILMKKYNVKKSYLRKGFIILSHILPGIICLSFLLNYLVEFNEHLVMALLVLLTLFASAGVVTTTANVQDLAPNFAGTQIGIMSFFGATTGFIYPTIAGIVTEERSDLQTWSIILGIIGGVYLLTGSLFILFGSASLQPWNEKRSNEQLNVSAT